MITDTVKTSSHTTTDTDEPRALDVLVWTTAGLAIAIAVGVGLLITLGG